MTKTNLTIPMVSTIHHRFEEQVERVPKSIAVICDHQQITYRELNERANQLARRMVELGVGSEQLIGIAAERSIDMVIAILAVLKTGGAYVALEPAYPHSRLAFIWQDAALTILLTQTALAERFAEFPGRLVLIDQDYSNYSTQNLARPITATHLSHVIYTSGSTGQPKGVLLEHGNVLHLFTACQAVFEFTEKDVWALFHTFAFDVSVWELWGALFYGGRVVIIPHVLSRSPADFYNVLCQEHITVLNQTPLAFYQLQAAAQQAQPHQHLSLRYIMLGGEVLDFTRLTPWFKQYGDHKPQLMNLYGLTETTVNVSFYPLTSSDGQCHQCVIGGAIPGVTIYLLDETQQPVLPGTPGEICVGGKGIARGYLNRPALTVERFVTKAGMGRFYRTGDLGRILANGTLEYLGRIDQQVQIHGFRVEPGEIEAVLKQHALVAEAVVIAREDEQLGDRRLVAYVVPQSEASGQVQQEQVADWEALYNQKYGELSSQSPPTPPLNNFLGWQSSYTGLPIPLPEMQAWVEHTIARLKALRPQKVLEIGCGTGLLLWRLAPRCQEYIGTDFSPPAIAYLQHWQQHLTGFEQVQLLQQEANHFDPFATQRFDTIILNSVVQYFPSLDYLRQVLEKAVQHVTPGGNIFVGDVRNFLLLPAFQKTVILAQAQQTQESLSPEKLQSRLVQNIAQEAELVIAPTFFQWLQQQLPQITAVKIWPKRGQDRNELTCFRYDVILQIGASPQVEVSAEWYDWDTHALTLDTIQSLLGSQPARPVGIQRIPNQRCVANGIDPEIFWAWADELAVQVEVSWLYTDAEGRYEVIFTPLTQSPVTVSRLSPLLPAQSLATYANTPWQAKFSRQLIPQLRKFLQERLPDYMVPSAIVKLDALPLTINGKVDKQALPAPAKTRLTLDNEYVAPQTMLQQHLVKIWQNVLGIEEPLGIQDNFFALGGDSLKVIQVIARAKDWQITLSFEQFFKNPTIAGLVTNRSTDLGSSSPGTPTVLSSTAASAEHSTINSYPLSPLQAGMLYHILREENQTGIYLIQFLLDIQGTLEPQSFARAGQAVLNRHPALRTSFHWQGRKQPVQVVQPQVDFQLSQYDWRSRSPSQQRAALTTLVETDRAQGFDLTQVPLLRFTLIQLTNNTAQLLLTYVHLILSEWEQLVMLEELFQFYEAFQAGRHLQLPTPRPFADFIAYLQQLDRRQQEQFWRHYLKDYWPTRLLLARPDKVLPAYLEQQWSLPTKLTDQLAALARQHKITLNTLLTGAYALLLSKYSRSDDVVFGMVFSGRNLELPGFEHTVGLFINTIPLRVPVVATEQLGTWLKTLQTAMVELSRYEHSALVDIQGWSEVPRGQDLFESILVFDEEPLDAYLNKRLATLHISGFQILYESTNYPLTFAVMKGEKMMVRAIFNEALFEAVTIQRLLEHYQTLLENLVLGLAANQSLQQLSLVSNFQRHQVLVEWNQTTTNYPRNQCIQQLFEEQVERSPAAIALVFGERPLSYAELNSRANQLGHFLRHQGIRPGQPVGLCLERSLEVIIGLLGILKAGGAYVPLDPTYPRERLAFMLQDTQLSLVLTQQHLLARLPTTAAQLLCLDSQWEVIAQASTTNLRCDTTAEQLAYIMYTSGTTGFPKGVSIPHRGVVRLVKDTNYVNLTSAEIFLQFAPISFDASTFEIWGCLLNGGRLVIMPPQLPSLEELGQVLKQSQITTLWLTAGLFHQMVDERLEDLTGVRQLLAGGDVLLASQVRQVQQQIPTCTLINGYGPTENTTFTCCYPMASTLPLGSSVPIGRPLANTQIYLLDHHGQPVPVGVPGELFIGGDGLAQGYFNRPELTKEKFVPHPFSQHPEDRLYKTGDLVYYLPDGNIEFVGRIDQQVKIRGFRIEPQELEVVLSQHPQISEVVVMPWEETPGKKQLVAYVVLKSAPTLTASDLRLFLKQRVPDYMIPSVFQVLATLPLTPNGKVDRRALPKPSLANISQKYVAPRTPEEELLAGIWGEVLGLPKVGVNDNFFELGGHSLLATQVISRIRDLFQVELSMRYLFESPTVAALVKRLTDARHGHLPLLPFQPVPRLADLPLSFAQQRLWFIENFAPGNAAYIVVNALVMVGDLKVPALEYSLREMIKRQESLRTTFPIVQGRPMQNIHASSEDLPWTLIDLSHWSADSQAEEVSRHATWNNLMTFELAKGPLIRFSLVRLAPHRHIFFLALHHIISDGWSLGVFYQELSSYYQAAVTGKAPQLATLPIQYVDFAVGQRQWLQGEVYDQQMGYWKTQLAQLPVFKFPTDYARPLVQTFAGVGEPFQLSEALTLGLETLSRTQGTTLFMTLLTTFLVLLFRYTGQTDIAIGSPIANRNRSEIEGLIGFFVNTIVLRANLSGNPTFTNLLQQMRQVTMQAYAHQDLPFEQLVEELQPERNTSVNPLVQVIFALQNSPLQLPTLARVEVSLFDYQVRTTRFDLEFHLWRQTQGGLTGFLIYNTDLFESATICRVLQQFASLLQAVLMDSAQAIEEISWLTETERQYLLLELNQTTVPYPRDQPVHRLFEAQVAQTPAAPALIWGEVEWSYQELNQRANQLARYLQTLGVGTETPVGVYLSRSFEMIVAVLGILKAGGFYVPLDPANPAERLRFILEDTGTLLVLIKRESVPGASAALQMICVEQQWPTISQQRDDNEGSAVTADNLCYVTYTSGSTGKAKGVSVVHRGVVRLVKGSNFVSLTANERFLQLAPLAFDASTFEIWGALLNGAQLVIASPEKPTLVELGQLLRHHQISTLWLTASLFQMMVVEQLEDLASVKQLLAGGEVLAPDTVSKVLQRFPDCTVINGYGPTENTTFTCCYPMRQPVTFGETVPIGRPISNTQVYILDQQLQLVPLGMVGELYTGGDGLARGYWKRPDLTLERFLPNPFRDETPSDLLYRTGDLVRWRGEGVIEFLGRVDDQVKIRGFRIELGEIDKVLSSYPAIKQSLTLARTTKTGDKRLVAYVVPDFSVKEVVAETSVEAQQVVTEWETVFNQNIYGQSSATSEDSTPVNFIGWNSSYTGAPIPLAEMQVWADYRIKQLLALRPQRVLEIGCGMGILLLPIAPHTTAYLGTDISQVALDYVTKRASTLPQVKLLKNSAEQFESLGAQQFDLCILNSLVQYFPSVDYLLTVLEGALQATAPGGCIFVGDVRNFVLLKMFQASVQLQKAEDFCTREELRQRVQGRVWQENELLIDPALFSLLPLHYPRITQVRLQLQRGQARNELTQFRYDVFLYLDQPPVEEVRTPDRVLDWPQQDMDLAKLQRDLMQVNPESMWITRIPNARLSQEVKILAWLESETGPTTVGEWKSALFSSVADAAVAPEGLWTLGEQLGYQVEISWSPLPEAQSGSYQALFWRTHRPVPPVPVKLAPRSSASSSWATYANQPLQGDFNRKIAPKLRHYLANWLPEYMIPSAFVVLSQMPLNANGKIDRRALPEPRELQVSPTRPLVSPQTELERQILVIWQEVLQMEEVGIDDNFFDLGGHSLLMVQVCSKVQKVWHREMTVVDMFQYPTVRKMANYLGQIVAVSESTTTTQDRADKQKQALQRRKQFRTTGGKG